MKKKIVSVMLVAVMGSALLAGCGSSEQAAATSAASSAAAAASSVAEEAATATSEAAAATTSLVAEFEPNADYEEYTLVDYTIEAIDAEFVATVSRMKDQSKYEIHCNFYGDEQVAVVENGEVVEDKTGFMATDSPAIIEQAEAQGNWMPIQ